MGAMVVTMASATQLLHSMQPMPAVRQPSAASACTSSVEKTLWRSKTGQTSGLPGSSRRTRAGSVTMVLSLARMLSSGSESTMLLLVALGHLAAVEAGEFGAGGEQDLRLGKDFEAAEGGELFGLGGGLEELVRAEVGAGGGRGFAGELAGLFEDGGELPGGGFGRGVEVAGVEGVEAAGDLAGELDVGDLVGADGDEVGLVEEDVGGLEERVAEEAVGGEVLFAELLLLVLVGGDALEPAERGEHAEEQEELGVLRGRRTG